MNICESDLVCYPKELFEELANMFVNICQKKPKVEFEVLKGIAPAICVLLKHDVCYVIYYINTIKTVVMNMQLKNFAKVDFVFSPIDFHLQGR